ncbi:MAG: dihydrodipicolinate synthase family protein [Planctomycetota bacterium]|jgi:4-hydroxy-tetrahydrodipicolinate synthase|nr:MAG: dihydrodipicolinate synthase family protein [Planctomycetota bacterium]
MAKFSGVIPPVVSPMKTPDALDLEAVDRVIEHLIGGGVSGLFVLGTTGEGPSLTYQMRYEMVERACERANGRVPVLVGVTDSCFAESLALAEHAATCGASAIVAAAPFYFEVSQSALQDWFTELADRSPLPVMLYNMPSCVGVNLDLAIVDNLSRHANIAGIKDSSGNWDYFQQLCDQHRDRDDFVIFMGPEELLAEAVEAGADGGVCGGANLLPLVYTRLYHAAVRADAVEIAQCKAAIADMFASVYREDNGQMKLIPGLKTAMEECGLCSRKVALPLNSVSESHAHRIRTSLPRLLAACEFSSGVKK